MHILNIACLTIEPNIHYKSKFISKINIVLKFNYSPIPMVWRVFHAKMANFYTTSDGDLNNKDPLNKDPVSMANQILKILKNVIVFGQK